MDPFTQLTQAVWATSSVEEKKVLLGQMVDQFEFPKKADKFRNLINRTTINHRLDKLATDIMLVGHGEGVI